jgi:hypothetical protein
VPPSDRYVLALDGRKFLSLVRTRSGLRVNCDAGTLDGGVVVHIRDNRFLYPTWPEGKANRPDAHTFAVQDPKRMDFLRVRFADPHRIEVMGVFFTGGQRDTVEIRDQGGIRWPGGGAPPGMTMDLRPFGNGTIDFERSGRIRVQR